MNFALHEHERIEAGAPALVVYDLEAGDALVDPARPDGPVLVWRLGGGRSGAKLAVDVRLDPGTTWLVRCDRVVFPPGAVAQRHVHPGPGIRRLLHGALTIEDSDGTATYGPGDAWFEGAEHPVLATASVREETAFVRVMLLPAEWKGRRTISYLDPDDEERPQLQRATILLEELLPR